MTLNQYEKKYNLCMEKEVPCKNSNFIRVYTVDAVNGGALLKEILNGASPFRFTCSQWDKGVQKLSYYSWLDKSLLEPSTAPTMAQKIAPKTKTKSVDLSTDKDKTMALAVEIAKSFAKFMAN